MNLASGVWRFALGACWLLQAVTALADERPSEAPPQKREVPRKRAVPNYDGRGGAPEPRARKALWVPRVLLYPAYVVSEYLVRRPLAAAITSAEQRGWPAASTNQRFEWGIASSSKRDGATRATTPRYASRHRGSCSASSRRSSSADRPPQESSVVDPEVGQPRDHDHERGDGQQQDEKGFDRVQAAQVPRGDGSRDH